MRKILTISLGTDENSYTIARSYHEATGEKITVCGAGVLLPFYKTAIAEIHTDPNFSSDLEVFAALLNSVYRQHADSITDVMILAPTEEYLHTLYKSLDLLEFKPFLPYPEKELGRALMDKSFFYEKMAEFGVEIPRTYNATPENFMELPLEGPQFIKAANYELFNSYDFPEKHKGFHAQTPEAAREYLAAVYQSGFSGTMIVQTYINGDHTQEYSVNGYRSLRTGSCVFAHARSVLSDHRPMWVGNHLLLTDTNRPDLLEICEKIVCELGYEGFFNIDFKVDAISGVPYVLEMNTRLGRSFYYANLNGVNFIDVALRDLAEQEPPTITRRPFNWITATREAVAEQLEGASLEYFTEEPRYSNTGNALDYSFDNNPLRTMRIARHRKNLAKTLWES
ncbi:ATP-grasp domain-containing protein [Arcanobacterium bovis]|uniref:Carboxylate--amine ligase n=1 Tax=Arcanobacterium bovis TaxID=2529275 RepID=A0A4Q9UZJ6_9ACTO|nr:ATP-grasp domain-containing protein [Arcanobacterium bovis]TBW21434.1 carboxylate--amine ligase [Arcanobacterium bovis]